MDWMEKGGWLYRLAYLCLAFIDRVEIKIYTATHVS